MSANEHLRMPLRLGIALVVALVAACGGGAGDGTEAPDDTADARDPGTPETTVAVTTGAAGTTAPPTTTTGDDPPEASPAGGEGGECTITVTGDIEEEVTYSQNIYSVATDYWMTEEELRETIEFLGEDNSGGTYEEITARGEPVITLLQMSCTDEEFSGAQALVSHSNATTTADLPMGPGSYPIAGGMFDYADAAPGTMISNLNLSPEQPFGTADGSGTLEITRWDSELIEGSFGFDATEPFVADGQTVHVEVSFSFHCPGWFNGC